MRITLLFIFFLFVQTTHIKASEQDEFVWGKKQNYVSCAIISSEYLTALQLYHRGLPLQVALKSLPKISADAKLRLESIYQLAEEIGVVNAYSDINTNFARCATLVNKLQGRPTFTDSQYGYYYCAGENKLRFEIILRIIQKLPQEQLYSLFPKSHHNVLSHYEKTVKEEGVLSAFELTANNLKRCLQQIYE